MKVLTKKECWDLINQQQVQLEMLRADAAKVVKALLELPTFVFCKPANPEYDKRKECKFFLHIYRNKGRVDICYTMLPDEKSWSSPFEDGGRSYTLVSWDKIYDDLELLEAIAYFKAFLLEHKDQLRFSTYGTKTDFVIKE